MKKIYPALVAVSSLLLPACSRGTDSLSDIKDATRGDSIAFFYGRSRGFDYWNEAQNDTSLRSDESRRQFLNGVEDGIKAVSDNDAYNTGLIIGISTAQEFQALKKDYSGVDVPADLYVSSLRAALENDTVVDGPQTKADLYRIIDDMQRQKELADTKAAVAALQKTATQLGMTKINEYLYGKIVANGSGQLLRDGDKASVDIIAATVDGTAVGLQFPKEIVVGKNLHSPLLSQALRTMKVGQTSQFLASPVQLMPRRYRAGENKATDLVKFTIKVNALVAPATAQEHTSSVKP